MTESAKHICRVGTARIDYQGRVGQRVLNTTIKSGTGLGAVFAPTWKMVMASKQNTISWQTYVEQYTALMRQRYQANPTAFLEALSSAELMALIPEEERRDLVCDLTEHIVEDYYLERGFGVPEYSYILHDREAKMEDEGEMMQQLHTHVVLPGTAPLDGVDRTAVYNNKERGHDVLFREIASRHFSEALDRIVGPEWQHLREEEPEIEPEQPALNDLDAWFPRS